MERYNLEVGKVGSVNLEKMSLHNLVGLSYLLKYDNTLPERTCLELEERGLSLLKRTFRRGEIEITQTTGKETVIKVVASEKTMEDFNVRILEDRQLALLAGAEFCLNSDFQERVEEELIKRGLMTGTTQVEEDKFYKELKEKEKYLTEEEIEELEEKANFERVINNKIVDWFYSLSYSNMEDLRRIRKTGDIRQYIPGLNEK